MVDATHAIVLMAPKGATLDVRRVSEVVEDAGARVIALRDVPVPVSLADRRTVQTLLIHCVDDETVSAPLRDLSDQTGVDIALQTRRSRCQRYQLAVFDMDSTLIDCEVIDELAAAAGVGRGLRISPLRPCAAKSILMRAYRTRLALAGGLDANAMRGFGRSVACERRAS